MNSFDGTAPQGRAQDARDEAEREKGGSRPHPGQRTGGSHATATGQALRRSACLGGEPNGRATTALLLLGTGKANNAK